MVECICDKIVVFKKKGMWMGGMVLMGYDFKNCCLFVNVDEVKMV